MKLFKVILIAVIIVLINSNRLSAQWVQTNGPFGGRILAMEASNNTVFASVYQFGLCRSTNAGASWKKVEAIKDEYIWSMADNGSDVFALSNQDEIFKSTDDGVTWDTVFKINTFLKAIAADGNNVYVGGSWLYFSSDRGATWTRKQSLQDDIQFLTVKGSNLFAVTSNGIFLSVNNGTDWTNIGLANEEVFAILVNGTNIFAGTEHGVYLSNNNGATWSNIGLSSEEVQSFAIDGIYLFAGTYQSLFFSTNNGISWNQVEYNNLKNSSVNSILVSGTNIFAGTDCGMYLSADKGNNWVGVSNGLKLQGFSVLVSNGNNIFAGGSSPFSGVFFSSDKGDNWVPVNYGLPLYELSGYTAFQVKTLTTLGNKIYAATTNGIYVTSDNGANWISAGLKHVHVYSLLVNGSDLYAGTDDKVFHTTENDTNWTTRSNGMPNNVNVSSFLVKDLNIFAATSGGLFISGNNGINWNAVNTASLRSLTTFGEYIVASSKEMGTVFFSTNSGANWFYADLPAHLIQSFAVYENLLFASSYTDGIYMTRNNFGSWRPVDTGIPYNIWIESILINNNYLYAGTWSSGVWKRPVSEFITAINEEKHPDSYNLLQNYPNPFNPVTTIKYSIQNSGLVSLKVYDLLGKEVTTVVNAYKNSGEYEVHFDGSNLPSGVYIYKLQSESFSETKKLILLK